MIPKWSKNNIQLIYINSDSLAPSIKTDDFYEDIRDDVKKLFGKSNYDGRRRKRPLPVGKELIGLMKDVKSGKIIIKNYSNCINKHIKYKKIIMKQKTLRL